jgi:hypothetical protein
MRLEIKGRLDRKRIEELRSNPMTGSGSDLVAWTAPRIDPGSVPE